MKITFFFKNLSESEKKFFQEYLSSKIEGIEKFVKKYDASEVTLRAKGEKFATKSAYQVTLELGVPGDNFLVSEDDHTIAEAVDLTKDKLVALLKKRKR